MTAVSWLRCSQVLAELTDRERAELKRVASGKSRSIPASVLNKLRAERLVQYDGKGWQLTDDGRIVAFWCH